MTDKIIFGVCARIADKTGINVTAIRVIWALLALVYGVGVGAYLIAALLLYLFK